MTGRRVLPRWSARAPAVDALGLEGAAYRIVVRTTVETITLSFTALVMTLLYFDLLARRAAEPEPEPGITPGSAG